MEASDETAEREDTARVRAIRGALAKAVDSDGRLAILVRAVEEAPDLSEIRWLLYLHYLTIGEHDAAQRQLALGVQRGARDLVIEQARIYPASFDTAALHALASESPVLAAGVDLARGRQAEARARLEAAVEESARAAYRGRGLARDAWLDVIAIAIEHDALQTAQWMLELLASGLVSLESNGDQRRSAEDLAAIELGLRELMKLPTHVPRAYRAGLARALRAATPEASAQAIHALRRGGDDEGAQVFRDLTSPAPTLAARFRRALVGKIPSGAEHRAPPKSTLSLGWALLAILIALVAFRRAC